MLEAKMYVFVEVLMSSMKTVRYITDVSPDKYVCGLDEFLGELKSNYQFKREWAEDISTKLKCGTPLIVDLLNRKYYRHDDMGGIPISAKVVRRADEGKIKTDFDLMNQKVNKILDKKYFTH